MSASIMKASLALVENSSALAPLLISDGGENGKEGRSARRGPVGAVIVRNPAAGCDLWQGYQRPTYGRDNLRRLSVWFHSVVNNHGVGGAVRPGLAQHVVHRTVVRRHRRAPNRRRRRSRSRYGRMSPSFALNVRACASEVKVAAAMYSSAGAGRCQPAPHCLGVSTNPPRRRPSSRRDRAPRRPWPPGSRARWRKRA